MLFDIKGFYQSSEKVMGSVTSCSWGCTITEYFHHFHLYMHSYIRQPSYFAAI